MVWIDRIAWAFQWTFLMPNVQVGTHDTYQEVTNEEKKEPSEPIQPVRHWPYNFSASKKRKKRDNFVVIVPSTCCTNSNLIFEKALASGGDNPRPPFITVPLLNSFRRP